jgi:hypothetical protein
MSDPTTLGHNMAYSMPSACLSRQKVSQIKQNNTVADFLDIINHPAFI